MRTENTSKPGDWVLGGFGVVLLLFLHGLAPGQVPGLHFDEAWAWTHAWNLRQGEFTLNAMSPYTAPWAHYWGALCMWATGNGSLAVFRLSQSLLSLVGIGLLSLSLWREGRRSTAFLLPLVVALIPGLVLNHRFAIELNGFHVLCLGWMVFAWQRRWWELAAFGWLMGTTSHILFYGLGLGFLGAVFWDGKSLERRQRLAGATAFFLVALFFLRVMGNVPEKSKAAALFVSAFGAAGLLLARGESWGLWRKSFWEPTTWLASALFLGNAFFFLDGAWSVSVATGVQAWKGITGAGLMVFLVLSIWLVQSGAKSFPRWIRRAFLLSVICLGLMMLKPAPRYFELILMGLALFFAEGLAQRPFLQRIPLVLFLVVHATLLYVPYFTELPRSRDLRFLFFKDSSRDFLSKQELVSVLGSSGCRLSDIRSVDARVLVSLQALARSDWSVEGLSCLWPGTIIELKGEGAGPLGAGREVADFVIREN